VPAVVIAIVDSGVDPHHPDLAGKLVAGYNTHDNTTNAADQYGHGTKMAGVAAARSNNGVGIAGVAGGAAIMPVRVTSRAGRATSASIAKGIIWAVDHGARVINLSLGGVVGNAAIRAAAEYAFNRGALVLAPSGNCGCAEAQAETPFILVVSATDETDSVTHFSTTGPFVKLSAPGANIVTTAMYGLYLSESGTSVASAIVAGVAALMFSANPALTPAAAAQLLQSTAFDGGPVGYDPGFGYGRVNAFAAVTAAAAYTPLVPVAFQRVPHVERK
jgi:subtilisin family serine protease